MANREMTVSRLDELTKSSIWAKVLLIAVFVALMTICSWVKVPAAIPVTLQTFAVALTVGVLGTKRSLVAIASWLAIGLAGAPVFAGFAGGIPYLLGPTGGYIIGFLGMALVTGSIIDRFGKSMPALLIAMVLGLLVCYAFGTAWFMFMSEAVFSGAELVHVLGICVVPFLIPDAIKMVLAAGFTRIVSSIR